MCSLNQSIIGGTMKMKTQPYRVSPNNWRIKSTRKGGFDSFASAFEQPAETTQSCSFYKRWMCGILPWLVQCQRYQRRLNSADTASCFSRSHQRTAIQSHLQVEAEWLRPHRGRIQYLTFGVIDLPSYLFFGKTFKVERRRKCGAFRKFPDKHPLASVSI